MCITKLAKLFEDVKFDVDLKTLTTVKTGGKAKVLVRPKNLQQLVNVLKFCVQNNLAYFVLGEGSNTLASDEGYNGVLLSLSPYFCQIGFEDGKVFADAGAKTSMLCAFCLKYQLSGAEFMASIPASVGGATVMNAGCFGQTFSDVVYKVEAVSIEGAKTFFADDLAYGYRHSVFTNNGYIVTKVFFDFKPQPRDYILQKIKNITLAKRTTQPLSKPSFGSVFKHCELGSPAKLIDDLGFKGFCYNGAKVSEKHAGFFINHKNATTNDFLTLIDIVGQKVLDEYGVILEPEVKYLGDKDDLGRLSYTHNL